jgi:transposase-like protein
VHSQKARRYRCTVYGRTFAASTGTAVYRLHRPALLFVQVATLLAYGCPPAAIMAAFGLDERTVAATRVTNRR